MCHEIQRRPDDSRDAVPHPECESFGMEVDHFVQRRDEETHHNRARVLLADGDRMSPKPGVQLLGLADAPAQLARLDGLQANVDVFTEEASDVRPMRLGEQPRTQRGRPDRIGLLDDQAPPDVEAGGGQPEREREHEREQCERGRHHLADGWPILLLRTPPPILAQAEAALDREKDDRHGGQEDTPDREKIEWPSVVHIGPAL